MIQRKTQEVTGLVTWVVTVVNKETGDVITAEKEEEEDIGQQLVDHILAHSSTCCFDSRC